MGRRNGAPPHRMLSISVVSPDITLYVEETNDTVALGRPERMHERIARSIARDIVAGRLQPGDPFPPSEELAARYDVSRTVGRETVQALSSAGLIDVRHGRRTTVTPAHEWKFLEDLVKQAIGLEQLEGPLAADLFETRGVLEQAVARMCAERATDEQLDALLESAEQMLAATRQRSVSTDELLRRLVVADQEFHAAIAAGSGNVVLIRMTTDIRRELLPTWALEQLTRRELTWVAASHVEIARALRARDAERVERELAVHLSRTVETTLKRALRPEQRGDVARLSAR